MKATMKRGKVNLNHTLTTTTIIVRRIRVKAGSKIMKNSMVKNTLTGRCVTEAWHHGLA
jgi:hypothetical protein